MAVRTPGFLLHITDIPANCSVLFMPKGHLRFRHTSPVKQKALRKGGRFLLGRDARVHRF